MFCRHKWTLLSETKTESRLEQLMALGGSMKKGSSDMLEKTHIQVFTCDKCGDFKRFVNII